MVSRTLFFRNLFVEKSNNLRKKIQNSTKKGENLCNFLLKVVTFSRKFSFAGNPMKQEGQLGLAAGSRIDSKCFILFYIYVIVIFYIQDARPLMHIEINVN